MPALTGRAALLCLLAWLLPAQPGLAAPEEHGALPCAGCHLEAGSETGPGPLRAPQEQLCAACHQGVAEASHPVGFVPGRPLPAAFPLDASGRMSCGTCHDPHSPGETRAERRGPGQDLCLACHERAFFAAMADQGHSLFRSGHLAALAPGSRFPAAGPGPTIDRYTETCLRCHENRFTPPGARFARASYGAGNGTGMGNHPVGVAYASQRNSLVALRPRALLPDQVVLPEGRVSCLSCHRAYAGDHGALVTAERGVCLNCHDM